jgi:hypothetical protein
MADYSSPIFKNSSKWTTIKFPFFQPFSFQERPNFILKIYHESKFQSGGWKLQWQQKCDFCLKNWLKRHLPNTLWTIFGCNWLSIDLEYFEPLKCNLENSRWRQIHKMASRIKKNLFFAAKNGQTTNEFDKKIIQDGGENWFLLKKSTFKKTACI